MKHISTGWNSRPKKRRRASSIGEAVAELKLIVADCRKSMANKDLRPETVDRLGEAARKIEAAVELLRAGQPDGVLATADVENPARELPACSVAGCGLVAGAVVDGVLLCGLHASQALLRRRQDR